MFALRSLHAANLATRAEHLASEARFLADQRSTFHGTLRESTQRLGGLLEKRFSAGSSAHPDEPALDPFLSLLKRFIRFIKIAQLQERLLL